MLPLLLLLACTTPDTDTDPPLECAQGEVADGERCVPEACGVGTWGDLPEADLYVDASFDGESKGTSARPFTDLQEAANLARSGTVAVAEGTYGRLDLDDRHDGLTVLGRCAELVHLDGGQGAGLKHAGEDGDVVHVSGVGITGKPGIKSQEGELFLADALVHDAVGYGLEASSSRALVHLERVRILDTVPEEGEAGYGVLLEAGADLWATEVDIVGAVETGLGAYGAGTTAELEEVLIQDVALNGHGELGMGLFAQGSVAVVARGLEIRDVHKVGLTGLSGAELEVEQALISGVREEETHAGVVGVYSSTPRPALRTWWCRTRTPRASGPRTAL